MIKAKQVRVKGKAASPRPAGCAHHHVTLPSTLAVRRS